MPDTVDLLALRRRVNRKRDPVMRTFQGISRVLPRLVTLSNRWHANLT